MAIIDPSLCATLPHFLADGEEEKTVFTHLNNIPHGGETPPAFEATQMYGPSANPSFPEVISPADLNKIRIPKERIGSPITQSPFNIYSPTELAQKKAQLQEALSPEKLRAAQANIHKVQQITANLSRTAKEGTAVIRVANSIMRGVISSVSSVNRITKTIVKIGATATGTVGWGAMVASAVEYTVAAIATLTGATAAPVVVLGVLLLVGVVSLSYLAYRYL